MPSTQLSDYTEAVMSIDCPACGAVKGRRCIQMGGTTGPHLVRLKVANGERPHIKVDAKISEASLYPPHIIETACDSCYMKPGHTCMAPIITKPTARKRGIQRPHLARIKAGLIKFNDPSWWEGRHGYFGCHFCKMPRPDYEGARDRHDRACSGCMLASRVIWIEGDKPE